MLNAIDNTCKAEYTYLKLESVSQQLGRHVSINHNSLTLKPAIHTLIIIKAWSNFKKSLVRNTELCLSSKNALIVEIKNSALLLDNRL